MTASTGNRRGDKTYDRKDEERKGKAPGASGGEPGTVNEDMMDS